MSGHGTPESRQTCKAVLPPKVYEYGHRESQYGSAQQALEAATNDALAGARLGLRVVIEPITWQAFRGGGNIYKATLNAYRLSFPNETVMLDGDPA